MTEGGQKLFKRVLIGMVGLFVVLYGVAEYTNRSRRPSLPKKETKAVSRETIPAFVKRSERADRDRPLPASTLSKELQQMAYSQYISHRLHKALDLWELSLYLDGANQLSYLRFQGATRELTALIQENIALGNTDYNNLRYARAVSHWEKALNLIRDEKSPLYQEMKKAMGLAKNRWHP